MSSLSTTAAADDLEKFMRVEDSPGRAAAISTKLPAGDSWLAGAIETVEETGAYRHSVRAPLLDHDPVSPWEWDRTLKKYFPLLFSSTLVSSAKRFSMYCTGNNMTNRCRVVPCLP